MNTKKSLNSIALGLGMLLGVAASAQAANTPVNLITNGSFESVAACTTCTSGSGTVSAPQGLGTNNVTGWDTSNAGLYSFYLTAASAKTGVANWDGSTFALGGTVGANADGGNFLALDQNMHGSVSQNVTGLVAGHTYTLNYSMATSQQQYGSMPAGKNASWGISFASASLGSSDVIAVTSNATSAWYSESVSFVATGTSGILKFATQGNAPAGTPPFLLLDGVSLTDTTVSAVPEPANAALLVIGMLALGGLSLHRRRNRD